MRSTDSQNHSRDSHHSDAEAALLWADFAAGRSAKARESLIIWYSPLVDYVAAQVVAGLPPQVEKADLISDGLFGLMDAIESFDPTLGTRFESFAIRRIRGAMFDELRKLDWVPRNLRSKMSAIRNAMATLESRLRRSPTDTELAQELGWTPQVLDGVLHDMSRGQLATLDQLVVNGSESGSHATLGETVGDHLDATMDPFELAETRQVLVSAVAQLPEQERQVLALYYFDGMTLAEVGRKLNVSESRACQVHTKALLRLRSRLDQPFVAKDGARS